MIVVILFLSSIAYSIPCRDRSKNKTRTNKNKYTRKDTYYRSERNLLGHRNKNRTRTRAHVLQYM